MHPWVYCYYACSNLPRKIPSCARCIWCWVLKEGPVLLNKYDALGPHYQILQKLLMKLETFPFEILSPLLISGASITLSITASFASLIFTLHHLRKYIFVTTISCHKLLSPKTSTTQEDWHFWGSRSHIQPFLFTHLKLYNHIFEMVYFSNTKFFSLHKHIVKERKDYFNCTSQNSKNKLQSKN